jgi:hypothetical protein
MHNNMIGAKPSIEFRFDPILIHIVNPQSLNRRISYLRTESVLLILVDEFLFSPPAHHHHNFVVVTESDQVTLPGASPVQRTDPYSFLPNPINVGSFCAYCYNYKDGDEGATKWAYSPKSNANSYWY